MTRSDIRIRGWGAVTTLGWSAGESAGRLAAGLVHPACCCLSSHLTYSRYRAFEVPYSGTALDKACAMLTSVVTEAANRAGLTSSEIAESSLFVGTTGGFFLRNEYEFTEEVRLNPGRETPAIACRNRGPGEVSDWLARKFGIGGMVMTFSMACVSSSHALVVAADLLELGKIKRAIVVGYEPLLNLTLHGFASLLLYDEDKCRPFCNRRSGMQIGEGAGAVIMEKEGLQLTAAGHSGKNNPAKPGRYAYWFAGGHLHNDCASLTSAGVDGELVSAVIGCSLKKAQLAAEDVVAVKAHGTGTRDNDLSEGRGLKKTFGENLPPVISLKGALGHSLGAAGAVETAVWLSCLEDGFIPQSFGFTEIDPEIGFAPSQAGIPASCGAYLFTFFGFGGACTGYLVIKEEVG